MDVVYYVRAGDANEQLRYSLRSLRNLPHERVWIAGHKPSWVTGVEHIPGNHRTGPASNAIDNLGHACTALEAERFVVFNDDFYVMEPIAEVPAWHGGPLAKRKRAMPGSLRAAYERLLRMGHANPIDWALHVPLVVRREWLRAVVATLRYEDWRTMYGNLASVEGEEHADVKVRRHSDPMPAGPFVSSQDRVPLQLRRLFTDPSPYEVAA